jgi:MFS family permease
MATRLDQQAFDAYLAEYAQCAATYMSTYSTIWSAGALFTAATAGLLVVAGLQSGPIRAALVFAPLPFLFWYLGLFRPMNRYAEWRTKRLESIEILLSTDVPGLAMKHFRDFNEKRKNQRGLDRFFYARVHVVVSTFFWLVVGVEVYLLWNFRPDDKTLLIPELFRPLLIAAVLILVLHLTGGAIFDRLPGRRRSPIGP